jgi:ABC-type antimicrobial peptide transport system permease subunit
MAEPQPVICDIHAERMQNIKNDLYKTQKELEETQKSVKAIELKLSAYAVYFTITIGIFTIIGGFILNSTLDGVKTAVVAAQKVQK